MPREDEVREIRDGMKLDLGGPIVLTWVERLMKDRDERLKRDREIASRLLGESPGEEGL